MSKNRKNDFVTYVVDLMQCIGPVEAKAMFGGHGLFLDGLMFALIADNDLYLKADEETQQLFTERGLSAFTYNRKDRTISMSYYQAPEETLEDVGEMNTWANRAYTAALRAAKQ